MTTGPAAVPASRWQALFAAPANGAATCEFDGWVVQRHGEPLLILPSSRPAARLALTLYPAQRLRARLARAILNGWLRLPVPLPLRRCRFGIARDEPFWRFLCPAGRAGRSLAIHLGNPAAQGRRFVILLFDEQQKPISVVKAAVEPVGRKLIEAEERFLGAVRPGLPGLPAILARFDESTSAVRAFALPYFEGKSPDMESSRPALELLSRWVGVENRIRWAELPAWQRLEKTCGTDALFVKLARMLNDLSVAPVTFHGDFVPWNIRAGAGWKSWNVLDWERGELIGPPGWDWFHYLILPRILVARERVENLAARLTRAIATPAFHEYAERTGIRHHGPACLIAYLLYQQRMIEGSLPVIGELLQHLEPHWLNDSKS